MINRKQTKSVMFRETKQEKVGREVRKEDFFFPSQDGFPAMTISAKDIEEATKMYQEIRQTIN